MFFRFLR